MVHQSEGRGACSSVMDVSARGGRDVLVGPLPGLRRVDCHRLRQRLLRPRARTVACSRHPALSVPVWCSGGLKPLLFDPRPHSQRPRHGNGGGL